MSLPSEVRVSLWDRVTLGYVRLVTPAATGLPNWRVVLWFPILAALGVTVLIALQLSGSSSGVHWSLLGTGDDPRLLFGTPRPIRSDEWLVQQSWVVSQSNTGYSDTNPTFPGGSDMVVLNELPNWHWSSLFRPHLWGYLLFGLDVGVAWHWWVPALALVSGCYLFVVSMLPRRPLTAAFFAVGIYFTPLLQWFYTPSSVLPVAWALIAMAGVVWVVSDPRLWVRVTWAAVVGFLAVTMAMGLYVPFMLPGLYVFVAFAVGYVLRERPWTAGSLGSFVRRVSPLLIAGLGAVVVTVVWVISRWDTVQAIQSTVYPGARTVHTGRLIAQDPFLAGFAGAPWGQALKSQGSSILGGNASEASTVILLAIFLFPAVLWFALRSLRKTARTDWLLVSCCVLMLVIAAYLLIPGWDGLAHLLQLDRVAPERFRIGFVVMLPLFAVLVIDQIDRTRSRSTAALGIGSAALTTAIMVALAAVIAINDPHVLALAPTWKVTVPLIIAAVLMLFFRRTVVVAAAFLALSALIVSVNVNPVYRGIFDLSETAVGKSIMQIDEAKDGEWLSLGSYEGRALLTQTGVGSYSGVQIYPSEEMWSEIDPSGAYEENWNRLAHINWVVGSGDPVMNNPSADVVTVTFDACADFAQGNVDYVISDTGEVASACLNELTVVTQGALTYRIYEVVPPR